MKHGLLTSFFMFVLSSFAGTNEWKGICLPIMDKTSFPGNTEFHEIQSEFSVLTNKLSFLSGTSNVRTQQETALLHDFLVFLSKGPIAEYTMERVGWRSVSLGKAGKYECVHSHSKEEVEHGIARNAVARQMYLEDFITTYPDRNSVQQRLQFKVLETVWFGDVWNSDTRDQFQRIRETDGLIDSKALLEWVVDNAKNENEIRYETTAVMVTVSTSLAAQGRFSDRFAAVWRTHEEKAVLAFLRREASVETNATTMLALGLGEGLFRGDWKTATNLFEKSRSCAESIADPAVRRVLSDGIDLCTAFLSFEKPLSTETLSSNPTAAETLLFETFPDSVPFGEILEAMDRAELLAH